MCCDECLDFNENLCPFNYRCSHGSDNSLDPAEDWYDFDLRGELERDFE